MEFPPLFPRRSPPVLTCPRPPKALTIPEVHPSPPAAIAQLKRMEQALVDAGAPPLSIEDCTTHHFAEGLYARQWVQPAGTLASSKTHKRENFLVLLKGEAAISDGMNTIRYVAPVVVKTLPGVKRAVLAITDIIIMTFHPNPDNETDTTALEDRYIIPESPPKRRAALENK